MALKVGVKIAVWVLISFDGFIRININRVFPVTAIWKYEWDIVWNYIVAKRNLFKTIDYSHTTDCNHILRDHLQISPLILSVFG